MTAAENKIILRAYKETDNAVGSVDKIKEDELQYWHGHKAGYVLGMKHALLDRHAFALKNFKEHAITIEDQAGNKLEVVELSDVEMIFEEIKERLK